MFGREHKARADQLEAELRIVRDEHDRQRQVLIRDLRAEFEDDLLSRLRLEIRDERLVFNRHRALVEQLKEPLRALLPEAVHGLDVSAPVIPHQKAEARIRHVLTELDEFKK